MYSSNSSSSYNGNHTIFSFFLFCCLSYSISSLIPFLFLFSLFLCVSRFLHFTYKVFMCCILFFFILRYRSLCVFYFFFAVVVFNRHSEEIIFFSGFPSLSPILIEKIKQIEGGMFKLLNNGKKGKHFFLLCVCVCLLCVKFKVI